MPKKATLTKRVKDLGGFSKNGHHRVADELVECLNANEFAPEEFSIRDLFESLVPNGDEVIRRLDPFSRGQVDLRENQESWDSSAFNYLTSRLVFTQMRQQYMSADFVLTQRVTNIPSRLRIERMPGLSIPFDGFADAIEEKMPYPAIGIDDDQVESNKTEKRGGILQISKEAVYFDRTGSLLMRAGQIGFNLGLRKEKRITDTVMGLTSAPNQGQTYVYNGTSYAVYQTATPWINQIGSNNLVTWDNIDTAMQKFFQMTDPVTGEYISMAPKELLVMPQKMFTAKAMMTATAVQSLPYGGTSGTTRGTVTVSASPIAGLEVLSSIYAYGQLVASGVSASTAAQYWLLADLQRAFGYVENFPLTVVQAPTNSEAEFNNDIVARFKASEMGIPVVLEPRATVIVHD